MGDAHEVALSLETALLPRTPQSRRAHIQQKVSTQFLLLCTASFLSVLSLINAASFGLLLVPVSTGLPSTAGVPIFLISSVVAQIALCFSSGVSFAAGGATIELIPLLKPIAVLVSGPALSLAEKASTLLAMLSCTSLIISIIYVTVSRLRLGGIFRCIPLIVLKSALTGVGVFLLIESVKMGVGLHEEADEVGQAQPGIDEAPPSSVSTQILGEGLPRLLATIGVYAGLAFLQRQTSSPFATLTYLSSAVAVVAALRSAGLLVLDQAWYFGLDPSSTSADSVAATEPNAETSMFGLLPLFSVFDIRFDILLSSLPYALSAAFVHALVTVTDLVALEGTATAAAEKAAKETAKLAASKGETASVATSPPAAFSLDREMGAIGVANLLAATVGVMPNYMQLTPSVVALRFTRGVTEGSAGPYAR